MRRRRHASEVGTLRSSGSGGVFSHLEVEKRPRIHVLALGLAGLLGAALVGLVHGVPLPSIHDEFSYVLMGETFARGRLTNPTPPFWEHLETFHVLFVPSYMGKYPPAKGLFIALGIVLGQPALGVWIASGFMVGAVTWMLQAWVGKRWAVIGGIYVLLNLGMASDWAQTFWGGSLAAAGGAILFGAIRRAWKRPDVGSGLLMGLGLLLLANTRPFEGFLLSLPVLGLGAFLVLVSGRPLQGRMRLTLGVLLVLGLGFFAMAWYNRAVTGDSLRMPYQEYQEQYAIAPNLLVGSPSTPPPTYRHQAFEDFWVGWDVARYRSMVTLEGFVRSRIRKVIGLMVVLGPAVFGLLFLRRKDMNPWAWLAVAGSGLALGGCLLTKAAHSHYLAPAAGPLLLLCLLGWKSFVRDFSTVPLLRRAFWLAFIAVSGLSGTVVYYPFFTQVNPPTQVRRKELETCLQRLPFKTLVLVEYPGFLDLQAEWVRNGPDPFQQQVLWAHSMGAERDGELLEAVPDRAVFWVSGNITASELGSRTATLKRTPREGPRGVTGKVPTCR